MALSQMLWKNTGNDTIKVRLAFLLCSTVKELRSKTAESQIGEDANMAGTEDDVVGEEGRILNCFWKPLLLGVR